MSNPSSNREFSSVPDSSDQQPILSTANSSNSETENDSDWAATEDWFNEEVGSKPTVSQNSSKWQTAKPAVRSYPPDIPVVMVETAFLASTSSLIWLVNYYFPLGPILRIFFSVPIALAYLRWGSRAAWMSALVSGLLLSVLMGPTRSILFFIPYGLLGVLLGSLWQRQARWFASITLGALLSSLGFFFKFWLLSILLGEDLWVYLTTQVAELAEWIFIRVGILVQPDVYIIQILAILAVLLNSFIYLFAVHLVTLVLFDRLGNPIPRPPHWVEILLEYEEE